MVKTTFRIYILLILALLSSVSVQATRQKKGDISFGLGFPELSSISVRYKVYDQFRTGLSVGWLPRSTFNFGMWDNLVSVSGDLFYHFGKMTRFSATRLFYVNAGINFILENPHPWAENWWNSYMRIGGEIFSTYNFGVNIHGGFIYNLNPEKNWAQMDLILPAFGVAILYRF